MDMDYSFNDEFSDQNTAEYQDVSELNSEAGIQTSINKL